MLRGFSRGLATLPSVRPIAVLIAVVAAAAALASVAAAQGPAKATVAVISGDLGTVAAKRVSGGDSASGSIPVKQPDGIALGDGFYSATTSSSDGTASAQAEADDVELFGGEVTASIVSRTATATAKGVKYRGTVRDLVLGDTEIGSVSSAKTYTFEAGKAVVNQDGAALTVTLTDDLNGFPAGTKVVVADVSATAGAAAPEPTATATATATATPEPTSTATPEP